MCAAEGTLLVIRNNRAEGSPASVWNANPHCRKASFSLTMGWCDGGRRWMAAVFVCDRSHPDKRGSS